MTDDAMRAASLQSLSRVQASVDDTTDMKAQLTLTNNTKACRQFFADLEEWLSLQKVPDYMAGTKQCLSWDSRQGKLMAGRRGLSLVHWSEIHDLDLPQYLLLIGEMKTGSVKHNRSQQSMAAGITAKAVAKMQKDSSASKATPQASQAVIKGQPVKKALQTSTEPQEIAPPPFFDLKAAVDLKTSKPSKAKAKKATDDEMFGGLSPDTLNAAE